MVIGTRCEWGHIHNENKIVLEIVNYIFKEINIINKKKCKQFF